MRSGTPITSAKKKKSVRGQAWWHTLNFLAPEGQKQTRVYEFETNLVCTSSSRPVGAA